MSLTTQQIEGLGQVQFDDEVFSAEDLVGFADLARNLDALGSDDLVQVDPVSEFGEGVSFTPEEAETEIKRQIEAGEFLPDLMEEAKTELGRAPSAAEAVEGASQIARMTLEGTISPEVQSAVASASRVSLVETDGKFRVEVDGDVVLSLDAGGPLGASAKVIAAMVVVLIDLIFVVLAIINVVATKNKDVAKRVTKVTNKYGEKFLKMLKQMLTAMKKVATAVRDAKDAGGRRTAVTSGAKDIGKAIFSALSYSYHHMWSQMKDVVGAFLSSAWQIFKTCASLAVSILTWVGTAGAVLAASIINLALAVVDLVLDSIKLAEVA
jgi:hypothetical protein